MIPVVAATVGVLACGIEATRITLEATETASTVFKQAKDDGRVKRDAVASERLGYLLVGPKGLTAKELQPLKETVRAAKADGKVTLDEADRILVEMERVAALHPPAPNP